MGGQYIAIGGLLRRRLRSARYLYVASNEVLQRVLQAVRKKYDPRWLFVLGAYHPSRHQILGSNGVYGSDYKGWIFQYEHRRELLQRLHEKLSELEDAHMYDRVLEKIKNTRNALAKRECLERSKYVRTRNNSTKNSVLKAASRKKLRRLQAHLLETD